MITKYEYFLSVPNPNFNMARQMVTSNSPIDFCEIEVRKHETEVKDKIKEVVLKLIDETPLDELCESKDRGYDTIYKISFDICH